MGLNVKDFQVSRQQECVCKRNDLREKLFFFRTTEEKRSESSAGMIICLYVTDFGNRNICAVYLATARGCWGPILHPNYNNEHLAVNYKMLKK